MKKKKIGRINFYFRSKIFYNVSEVNYSRSGAELVANEFIFTDKIGQSPVKIKFNQKGENQIQTSFPFSMFLRPRPQTS